MASDNENGAARRQGRVTRFAVPFIGGRGSRAGDYGGRPGPPEGFQVATLLRRRLSLGLDLLLSVAAFFVLFFGGLAIDRIVPASWSALTYIPTVLWLAVLFAFCRCGQTTGQALLGLTWVGEDGRPARWRPLGEPAFWVMVAPVFLTWTSVILWQAMWMLCWPLYVLLWHSGLRDVRVAFIALDDILPPVIVILVAVTLPAWWTRRRPTWLVRRATRRHYLADLTAEFPARGYARPVADHRTMQTLRSGSLAAVLATGGAVAATVGGARQLPSSLIGAGLNPVSVQANQRTGRVFVLEGQASDTDGHGLVGGALAVFDGANLARRGSIALPDGACAMALDEQTRRAVVLIMRDVVGGPGEGLSVAEDVRTLDIDRLTAVRTLTLARPTQASLRPPGSTATFIPDGYTSNCDDGHIAVDDVAGHIFVSNAVSYVENQPTPFVAVLDARSGALLHNIQLSSPPAQVVAFPRIHRLLVTSLSSTTLWTIDSRSCHVLRMTTIRPSIVLPSDINGGSVLTVAADRDSNELLIGRRLRSDGLLIVDARNGRIQRTIATNLGTGQVGIAVDGRRQRAFVLASRPGPVAGQWSSALETVDLRRGRVRHSISTVDYPTSVMVDEDSGRVYVLAYSAAQGLYDGFVQVLDGATGTPIRTQRLGFEAVGLTVAQRYHHVFVAGQDMIDAPRPFWPWEPDDTYRDVLTMLNTGAGG